MFFLYFLSVDDNQDRGLLSSLTVHFKLIGFVNIEFHHVMRLFQSSVLLCKYKDSVSQELNASIYLIQYILPFIKNFQYRITYIMCAWTDKDLNSSLTDGCRS